MSRITNCVFLTCDRCSRNEYYPSINHARNLGWELDVKIPDETPLDLCPSCSAKWGNLVQEFLYGDVDQEAYGG